MPNKLGLIKLSFLMSLVFLMSFASTSDARKYPEVKFPKKHIVLGGKKLTVEVAKTEQQVARGLMFRNEPLKDTHGMLFIFDDEKVRSFWMKNTFIPLVIGFFDKDRKLVSIKEMKPVKSEMEKPLTYSSDVPAKYALELDSGWFDRQKVPLGTVFSYR